jgi:hypothetical protein
VKLTAPIALLLPAITLAAADIVETIPPDNDFSPAVFFAFLFICAVCLVLIGVGVVIGLVVCGIAAALVAAGVLSTSVMAGLTTSRPVIAVRVFVLQCGLLAGIPSGILCAWAIRYWLSVPGSGWLVSMYGAIGGAIAGAGIALILDFIFRRIHAWTSTKVISKTPRATAALVSPGKP